MDGSAQRFSFKAHGEVEFCLACDLRQARIWLWPGVFGMRGTYKTLVYSSNVDERDVRRRWLVTRDENSDCFGIDLTAAEGVCTGEVCDTSGSTPPDDAVPCAPGMIDLLGELIEVGETKHVFEMPEMKSTEDYITGRFG